MLARRLIVCLDVDAGRVVKGTRFSELRVLGVPAAMAATYERDGADEIVFLDISASAQRRATVFEDVRRTAEQLSIPLTVGGGVRSLEDIAATLRAGGDKVAMNTAAVEQPQLIAHAAERFGAQCVVVSIDARKHEGGWRVVTHGGRRETSLEVLEWAERAAALGAGELLLTSIDQDGTRQGYDRALTREVAQHVSVPVIASGGAGVPAHLADALHDGAEAVLVAGILHDGEQTVRSLKSFLARAGFAVRAVESNDAAIA